MREPAALVFCRALLRLGLVLLVATSGLAGDRKVRLLSPEEAGYEPYVRFVPTTAAGRVDWALVTPQAQLEAYAPLVRHRRDMGLAAEVVTLEHVAGDVLLGGGDVAERLRNFVRYLHREYGLRYVVLGADTNLLPSRLVPMGIRHDKVNYGEPYAGDAYFGCLDGEWNADADARFGEAESGDDDAPDVEHEVHVGRIPTESSREVEVFVEKLLRYERPQHVDYQDRVAYLGGKVFIENDADQFYRKLHEEVFGPQGFQATYFTSEAGENVSTVDVLRHLSEGVGVVCHYHHSFTYNLSLPKGALDTGNVAELGNAERPFVLFSNGCYANQFTKEGISEKLALSPTGGAIAFIGSTNTCFTSSLTLERRFWDELFERNVDTLGEALSNTRAAVGQGSGVMGFLRLSFNLLGDPATRLWKKRPAHVGVRVEAASDGSIRVLRRDKSDVPLRVSCVQEGKHAAWRDAVTLPADEKAVTLPPVIGNGTPLRVTVFGPDVVPVTTEIRDPSKRRLLDLQVEEGTLCAVLSGGREERFDLSKIDRPGPAMLERDVDGAALRIMVSVLDGADLGFVRGDEEWHLPGFQRMAVVREGGLPILLDGPPHVVEPEPSSSRTSSTPAEGDLAVEVESTDASIRLGWKGARGARWIVERVTPQGPRLLTPLPLTNPVFELTGLEPLRRLDLVVSRLGRPQRTAVEASTTFAYQRGFPQKIGSNVTSVQLVDLDGKRGHEIVFGDDKLGLWALHEDGSEVRHAGDSWTFGLFAAIENGVFEPVVADFVGSRKPEILATSKLKDRRLYAFHRDGRPVDGFPVSFKSRLMTPPLVGDFDGKRGSEILVVSGFGKTIELVRPDGTKKPFATIGQYNYAYPIAVNLDRDRALEVVLLDGAGALWAFDQGGKPMKGYPVELGGPGRATPMVADLDKDRGLEIVALGKGTTRLAVIDGRTGTVQADLSIPDAGKPANHSFFYPGLADLQGTGQLSIVLGTPSKKLFAFHLVGGEELVVRDGFPIDLPAEARGVVAVDVDADGRDELFLSLHNGEIWGLGPDGTSLVGFPLRTHADTYAVPLLDDLDGDGDLELFLGAADGELRVWDLPYRKGRKPPTWCGLLGGAGMPGAPAGGRR